MKMNKKGGLGSSIAMFVAIIMIFIILAGFTLMAGMFKVFAEKPAGVDTVDGDGIAGNFFNYVDNNSLDRVKFVVAKGKSLNDAILEVGYEER